MDTDVAAIETVNDGGGAEPRVSPPFHLQMSAPPAQTAPLPVPVTGSGQVHTYFLLDTNVLMTHNCLKVLQKLLDALLAHNLEVLCKHKPGAFTALLVPRIVIHELEGLKSRRNNGPDGMRRCVDAQAGSRFILSALKWQNEAQASRGLPKSAWALHVQTIEHALERERSLVRMYSRSSCQRIKLILVCCLQNNDEKIVRLAAAIQKECHVMLFTHDVIASVSAEAEGVTTFDLQQTLESSSQARTDPMTFIKSFVEQWSALVMRRQGTASVTPDVTMPEDRPTEGLGWRLCTDGTEDAHAVIEILDDDAEMEDLDSDPSFRMEPHSPAKWARQEPSALMPSSNQLPSIPTSSSDPVVTSLPASACPQRTTAPLPKRARDPAVLVHTTVNPCKTRPEPPPLAPTSRSCKRSAESSEERQMKRIDRDVVFLVSSDDESDDDEPVVLPIPYVGHNLVPKEGDIKLDASYFGRRGGLRLEERIGRAKLSKSQRKRLRAALKSLKAAALFPGKADPGDRSDAVEAFTNALRRLAGDSDTSARKVRVFRYNDQTRIAFQPFATPADIPKGMPSDLTAVAATFELVFSPHRSATLPAPADAGSSNSKFASNPSKPKAQGAGQPNFRQGRTHKKPTAERSSSYSASKVGSASSKWAKP